jgi:hypothetical protein
MAPQAGQILALDRTVAQTFFYCGEGATAICVVLGPKKSSMYSSEYTSGFSGPAAWHLAAPPSPRDEEGLCNRLIKF